LSFWQDLFETFFAEDRRVQAHFEWRLLEREGVITLKSFKYKA
jgi:hypothetical protein